MLPNEPGGSGGSSAPGAGGASTPEGGATGAAGAGQGGATGTAGKTGTAGATGSGGATGTAGKTGTAGTTGAGGKTGAGGMMTSVGGATGTTTDGGSTVDCSGTLPAGGTVHTSMNTQGGTGALSWSIWTNTAPGTITTFGTTPAFSGSWTNSGDYLARLGEEWGNSGKTFDKFGTITAQFAETKTGSAGGFSYIGIYGWSTSPCIEWYIVEDSFNKMPVNPGNTTKMGTAMIDGGMYTLYTRPTTGTGGSRCGASVGSWTQFYSVRQTARQCGQISITQHFQAWAAAGMTLGNMLEAKVLIETGGGTGSINFTTASVTAQ